MPRFILLVKEMWDKSSTIPYSKNKIVFNSDQWRQMIWQEIEEFHRERNERAHRPATTSKTGVDNGGNPLDVNNDAISSGNSLAPAGCLSSPMQTDGHIQSMKYGDSCDNDDDAITPCVMDILT